MNFKHVEILQSLHLIMNLPSLLEMPEPFLRDNRTGSVGFISSISRCYNISIFSISYTCGTLNETCSHILMEPRVLCLLHKLSDTRFQHTLLLSKTRCAAVIGNLIPVRGRHYWEVEVDERLDYTIGVACEDVPKQEDLGANCLSWCMRHTFASTR